MTGIEPVAKGERIAAMRFISRFIVEVVYRDRQVVGMKNGCRAVGFCA